MKKRALHSLFACLCVSALASCGAQQALCFAPQTTLDTSANTIKVGDKPVFKVSTSVLNLKEEQLALNKEALPKERAAYIASILKESHSDQDTIIAASPSFILVKSTGTHSKRDVGWISFTCTVLPFYPYFPLPTDTPKTTYGRSSKNYCRSHQRPTVGR